MLQNLSSLADLLPGNIYLSFSLFAHLPALLLELNDRALLEIGQFRVGLKSPFFSSQAKERSAQIGRQSTRAFVAVKKRVQ